MKRSLLMGVGFGLGMTFLTLKTLFGPLSPEAVCDLYVVSPGGEDVGLCTGSSPCLTVQYAVNQAGDDDVICIVDRTLFSPGPSVYTGTVNLQKSVTLDGAWDAYYAMGQWYYSSRDCEPERVILDAQGTGRTVTVQAYITPTIRCLSITGGDTPDSGGGIHAGYAHPLITGCLIYGNTADVAGGGVEISNSPGSELVASEVYSNVANNSGGGVSLLLSPGVLLLNNWIHHNETEIGGGGVRVFGSDGVRLVGNLIHSNRVTHSVGYGGGIDIYSSDHVLLAATEIYSNTANSASGIHVEESRFFSMTNSIVARNNTAGVTGAATFFCHDGTTCTGLLVNNTVAQNTGHGIFLARQSTLTLTNNIVVGHATGIYARPDHTNTVSADYTLFYGNTDDVGGSVAVSAHAITGNPPLFVDPAAWDYHILPNSPAIDAGTAVPWLTTDIDGDQRPWPSAGAYDLGADETPHHAVMLPVVLRSY